MKRRSYIYEEIITFLAIENLLYKEFYASSILIQRQGKVITSFLYKHSNINYDKIWTLFFIRNKETKPLKFQVELKILRVYEKKFNLKLI
jgi:hypothetical protein